MGFYGDHPTAPYDWSAGVRVRVQRACQSPYFSLFREENTRQANAVYEGCTAGPTAEIFPAIQEDGQRLLFFPFRNAASVQRSFEQASGVAPEAVTLIGATGTVGKFVAEQYLRRGISVSVLARDVEKAKSIFLPIANGEREANRAASMGYVQLGSAAQRPDVAAALDYCDPQRGHQRVLRYVFQMTRKTPGSSTSLKKANNSGGSGADQQVTLELIEGDVGSTHDLEFSMRHASVVYYLAAALEEVSELTQGVDESSAASSRWWSSARWWGGSSRRFGGFLNAFDACRRVDAHFVTLTPLWVHGSHLSPYYWYRRLFVHPRGYCKAVRRQEQTLLSRYGNPTARCFFGFDAHDEEHPGDDWRYWWRIWLSTELPEDMPMTLRKSPVRFSLFRLSDIVYPSFHDRIVAAKNNCVDNGLHVNAIQQGNLDAGLLSNVLVKSIGLCKSVVGSRIDIGGRLRGGVDMRNAGAVFDLFDQFRNE